MVRALIHVLAVASLVAAPPLAAPARSSPPVAARDDDTPLMKEMEKLDAAMEFLKRSVIDAAQDAKSLEQITLAQQACVAAKSLIPKMAPHVAEAERAKFVVSYRKGMATLLIELANLETAVLDGDRDRARATWKKLDGMKDDGHNEFTEGE
jgi:soluble cytochrome b562